MGDSYDDFPDPPEAYEGDDGHDWDDLLDRFETRLARVERLLATICDRMSPDWISEDEIDLNYQLRQDNDA